MQEISLIPGANENPECGAFDPAKLRAGDIDNLTLGQALTNALSPFAGLLREGCGFAVVDKGAEVSIIGIATCLTEAAESPVTAKLTRDQARAAYAESGIDFFPLTLERLCALRDTVNREMLNAELMDGTFHMAHPSLIRLHGPNCAELRCKAHYFEDREAITFNDNGFVGFAGWADDDNIQPILRGFMAWVEHEAEVAELN